MLEACLRAAGYRTGLYTSPHLIDFSERIRIEGRTIPHETVVGMVAELRAALAAAGIALTHFEFTTLLAFEWFARVGIDVGVIEVGLGGRLDATNLVRPVATAITSIALDHEAYLGTDLATIAAEKAGILKAGIPLALGRVPSEAERVILARAEEVGAPVMRLGPDPLLEPRPEGLAFRAAGVSWEGLRVALPGAFQRDNAAVALMTLALVRERFPLDTEAVQTGLATVCWPGRLARVRERPLVLLDGAHNPAGVATLVRELPAEIGDRPIVLVFAAMADKDWQGMLRPLLPKVRRVVVTRVGRRGAEPRALAAALGARVPIEAVDEPRAALRAALDQAEVNDAVVVTGSLFLVGEAYAEFGARGAVRELFEPWQPPETDGTEAAT
jgi:dihydrofolate synthase/folylpolyglutamate synthase